MSGEIVNISRREFIKTTAVLGGGLVLACYIPFPGEAEAAHGTVFAPNAFVRVASDGNVTIIVNHSEMGQGVYTSLPMIVAEELECDWKRVRVEPAPVNPAYNHLTFGHVQATGGSTSVRTEWERLARMGAMAREMLIAAAARKWKVDPHACRAQEGRVTGPGGKSLGYGELAAHAAKLAVPKEVRLKKPADYRLIGRPVHRTDSPAKVAGTTVFGIDVHESGMLTAVIARPPVFGATVKKYDATQARKVKGVRQVVETPVGVAVVADGFWAAKKGRDLLKVDWDEGKWASLSTESLREEFTRLARKPGAVARRDGSPEEALAKGAKRLEARYEVPYLAHACMEPLNCFVDLGKNRCRIRTGTQAQTDNRDAAALTAGLKREQVTLETTFLGGGFGRRGNPASDFVVDAVQVAKKAKEPVKVIRTREDDMRAGWYRPMFVDRLEAALDASGNLSAWRHTIVGQSVAEAAQRTTMMRHGIDNLSVEGAADIPYLIPNLQVDLHTVRNGVPVQWWRSVGHSHTAFVVEGFLDEVAHAAGKDPVEFRLSLLSGSPRHRKVLETVAEHGGWGKPLPSGRGRGVAVHASYGSIVAHLAEVSVDKEGHVRVHRVVCAVDCGRFVNPDTIRAQMESGIVYGLSAALHGDITLEKGRVQQGNFDSYPILRLKETPEVEVHIMENGEKPGGIGEPGVPPIAPAVANALFAATGARMRSLPLLPDKVLAAMGKK